MLILSAVVVMVLTSRTFAQEENKSLKTQDIQPRVEIDPDLEKQVEQELSMMRRLEQDHQYLNEIEDEKKRVKKAALFETLSDEEIGSYGYASKCSAWYDIAKDEEREFSKNYNTAKKIWLESECGVGKFIADMEEVKKAAGRRAICAQYLGGVRWLSNSLGISYLAANLVQTAASAGCIAYDGTVNIKLLGAYYGAFKHYAYSIYYTNKFDKCGKAGTK